MGETGEFGLLVLEADKFWSENQILSLDIEQIEILNQVSWAITFSNSTSRSEDATADNLKCDLPTYRLTRVGAGDATASKKVLYFSHLVQ